jgi:hemerythrin superfamily protein
MKTTPHDRNQYKVELGELLSRDHQRLSKLFEDLVVAFRADARDDAAHLWSEFEAGLLAHLELEEKRILPKLAQVDAAETKVLLQQHDRIRAQLSELGVGVDLHLTHSDAVTAFVQELEAHAKREEALLYRWLKTSLPQEDQATIRAQVLGMLHKIGAKAVD